jgi:hypothetical protein
MGFNYCSVADVTFSIKATQDDAGQTAEYVWYGGTWMKGAGQIWTLCFKVVYNGASPGLYAWDWYRAATFYVGETPPTLTGAGTLVKAFTGSTLEATLRFTTSYDGEGHGSAEMFCDDVSVEKYTTPGTEEPVELEDLVSNLYIAGGAWTLAGDDSETMHVGPISATVWELDDPGLKVLVTDDAPTTIATASRVWPAWVTFIKAGGDEDDYDVANDLYATGTFSGYTNWETDEDGWWYETDYLGKFIVGTTFNFCMWYVGKAPTLALTHNAVADTILVTDCGLSAALDVGYWRVQRTGGLDNQWSERTAIADTAGAVTANVISSETGIVLVEELGGETKVVPGKSLGGDWGTPVVVGSALEAPFGMETQCRYGLVALTSGNLEYRIIAKDGLCTLVHEKVDLYPGVTLRTPVVVRHRVSWRLYAAVMGYSGDSVSLLTSSDSGLTWQHANAFGGYVLGEHFHAAYPYLWVDRDYLWLAVYRDTPTEGATGQCVVYQLRHEPVLLEPPLAIWPKEQYFDFVEGTNGTKVGPNEWGATIYSGAVVGPADAGRPAIIRDPQTWALTAIVPKTTAWTDTSLPTPGIVEYGSTDTGKTWAQRASHGC